MDCGLKLMRYVGLRLARMTRVDLRIVSCDSVLIVDFDL